MQEYSSRQGLLERCGTSNKRNVKKAREQKIKLAYEALDAGVEEVKSEGVNEYLASLAEARKHSYSDNAGARWRYRWHKRRMFSRKITDTDKFIEMPATTQNLYFHLNMKRR